MKTGCKSCFSVYLNALPDSPKYRAKSSYCESMATRQDRLHIAIPHLAGPRSIFRSRNAALLIRRFYSSCTLKPLPGSTALAMKMLSDIYRVAGYTSVCMSPGPIPSRLNPYRKKTENRFLSRTWRVSRFRGFDRVFRPTKRQPSNCPPGHDPIYWGMNSDDLQARFNQIRIWQGNGQRAPHKPLLVLWAIGRCLHGKDRMASYEETHRALKPLLRRFGSPRKAIHTEHPFWRLRNDGIWEVSHSDHITLTTSGDAHVSALRRQNTSGGFPKAVFCALQANTMLAVHLAYSLADAHFPPTMQNTVLQAVGIEPAFEYVRRRPRDASFSKTVLAAYDHQCAVCSFSVRLDNNPPIGLEAAHIRWHCAQGPDQVRNALSLCALHHKLFDYGAFTLSAERRKIVVSASATGKGSTDSLKRFHTKAASLPENDDDLPSAEFLQWHHDKVFVGSLSTLEQIDQQDG